MVLYPEANATIVLDQGFTDTAVENNFVGPVTYVLSNDLAADVTVTDAFASTVKLPAGLVIDIAKFLADGAKITLENGSSITFLGSPELLSFEFGNGAPQTFGQAAVTFGATIPEPGADPEEGDNTGVVDEDGEVTPLPMLTLQEALDKQDEGTLPDRYKIDPAEPVAAGTVNVADADSTYDQVEAILAGADNSAELVLGDVFNWSIEDAAANIFDGNAVKADIEEEISGADEVTVTTPISDDQASALEALNENANYELLGESLDLTTGTDILTPTATPDTTALTSDLSDIINGAVPSISADRTLNPADQIDGGAGDDLLKVSVNGDFDGFTGDGKLENVETVELTNTGPSSTSRDFSATGVTGVKAYNLTGLINLENLASTDAAVNFNSIASGEVEVVYASKVTDGASDTLALGLNNVGTVGTGTTEEAVTVTATGIETLDIKAMGDNVVSLGADTATSIKVTGGSTLKIKDVGTGMKTYDGSGMTGDQYVDAGAADKATKLLGGSGNDTFAVSASDLAVNATINGGSGDDTLALNGGIGTVQYQMANVETVQVNDGATVVFAANSTEGLQTVVLAGGDGNKAQFANLNAKGALDLNVNLVDSTKAEGTFDNSGLTVLSATGGTSAEKNETAGEVTLANSSSVDLQVSEYSVLGTKISAGKAQTFTANNMGEVKVAAGSTFTNVQEVNINSTGSSFDFEEVTFDKLEEATLSGTGNVALGDLGGQNDAALKVTATGFDAVTIGKMVTSGAQPITVNAYGVTGTVSLGAINAGDGNVTLDFSDEGNGGTGGDIKVDGSDEGEPAPAIQGKEVTIDASSALGNVEIAAHVGDDVKGENPTVRTDAIVADTVTFKGSSFGTNGVGATVTSSAEMTGGNYADVFVINAKPSGNEATITLTGGLGNDIFAIARDAKADTTGAVRVTITDYNAGDITNDKLAANTHNFGDDKAKASAFLNTVDGISGATKDNVTILDSTNGTGTAILFGGDTFFVVGDTNDEFGDGDVLIELSGVRLNADDIEAFFGYDGGAAGAAVVA